MKKCFCSFLLLSFLLFLLLSSSTLSTARNIAAKEELVEVSNGDSEMATQEFASLMGEKTCNGGEGEEEVCLRRRIISEAHLDYIYSQHHKP